MRAFPDFGLRIMGFLREGMSVYVGRAAGNTSHGEAGRGCRDPGLAKLNYSVLVARSQRLVSFISQWRRSSWTALRPTPRITRWDAKVCRRSWKRKSTIPLWRQADLKESRISLNRFPPLLQKT
jgi:hypothetical protein